MTEANKKKIIEWLDAQITFYNNSVLEINSEKFRLENLSNIHNHEIHLNHNIDEVAEILDLPVYSRAVSTPDHAYDERYFMHNGFKFFALYEIKEA